VRLGLVSATYPFAAKEPYLDVELRALAPALEGLVVYPAAPQSSARGFDDVPGEVVGLAPLAPATLALALRAVLAEPRRVLAAVRALLFERYPLRAKAKNLAVLPKGLALATIARERGLQHLHAYWLSTPASVAWIASRVAAIPFSATAHRWDIYEDNMTARKLRDAAFVRTISERGRRDLLARTGGDPDAVHVVRLGVDFAERASGARAPDRANDATLRILCAAALVPVKGHDVLLEALALLRERGVAFTCTLAGDGPLRSRLARRIDALGLRDRVTLAGTVAHEELLRRLDAGEYDVSVLASIEREFGFLMEGVPVALIEAMASGTVVVASASGSIGELVDGTNGLLVAPGDVRALADALARVAESPTLRERLRSAALVAVRERFDIRSTTPQLLRLIAGA